MARKTKEAEAKPPELRLYYALLDLCATIGRGEIERIYHRIKYNKIHFPLKVIIQGLTWIDFPDALQACEKLSKPLSKKVVDLNLYKQIRLKEAEERRIAQ